MSKSQDHRAVPVNDDDDIELTEVQHPLPQPLHLVDAYNYKRRSLNATIDALRRNAGSAMSSDMASDTTSQAGTDDESVDLEHQSPADKNEETTPFPSYPFSTKYQWRALFRKNASIQMKWRKSTLFTMLGPLLIMLFIPMIQRVIDTALVSDDSGVLNDYTNTTRFFSPGLANLYVRLVSSSSYRSSNSWDTYLYAQPTVIDSPGALESVGFLTRDGKKSGLLGLIPNFVYHFPGKNTTNTVYSPSYAVYQGEDVMSRKLYSTMLGLQKKPLSYFYPLSDENDHCPRSADGCIHKYEIDDMVRPERYELPAGALSFTQVTPEILSLTIQYPYDYAKPNSSTYTYLQDSSTSSGGSGRAMRILNDITNAVMKAFDKNVVLVTCATPLPSKTVQKSRFGGDAAAIVLIPLSLSFLMPNWVWSLVNEKQMMTRELMRLMGLSSARYFVVNYVYFFITYLMEMGMMILMFMVIEVEVLTETGFAAYFIFFMMWGVAAVALSFLLVHLFSGTRNVSSVVYLIVIFSIIFSLASNNNVLDTTLMYVVLMFYPPFALTRGVWLMSNALHGPDQRALGNEALDFNTEFGSVIWHLLVSSTCMIVLTCYLDVVHPGGGVVGSRRWCWCFGNTSNETESEIKYVNRWNVSDSSDAVRLREVSGVAPSDDDHDVSRERRKIFLSQIPRDSVVIAREMRKEYRSTEASARIKVAVDNLCFHVEKGDVFGLLGPVGAGKTSVLSMLVGTIQPTSGIVRVLGADVKRENHKIQGFIGVAFAQDVLWDELTTEEHLLFYARMKGVPISDEFKAMEAVSLTAESGTLAGVLSEGSRRKLSVACAMLGCPKLLVLDEPQLWSIIKKWQSIDKDRAIILSTHSIDEAKVLCSRIGILAQGAFQALGSPRHLRNKFGDGYILSLKHDNTVNQDALFRAFIKAMFPASYVTTSISGAISFFIPKDSAVISQLFIEMDKNKDVLNVREWGIYQTGLEDAFNKIVSEMRTGGQNKKEVRKSLDSRRSGDSGTSGTPGPSSRPSISADGPSVRADGAGVTLHDVVIS